MPCAKKTEQNLHLRTQLMNEYSLPRNTRAIIIVDINNHMVVEFLQNAGTILNISFIEENNESILLGADAYITDKKTENIQQYLNQGIVPIVSNMVAIQYTLTEFNPMKFEGNAFIFQECEGLLILEKVIRYLENIRYPGDKKVLFENIRKSQ